MNPRSSLVLSTVFVSSILAFSGCLKTRSQLKREQESDPAPKGASMPVQVTEVNPDPKAVDELRGELMRMSGRLEELERTNQDLSKQNTGKTEEAKKLEARIQELESTQVQLIEALKKKEKEAPKVEPTAFFEQAKVQMKGKKYSDAVASFDEYLKFPKGQHLEEAHFLRGEAYYAQKQYKKAILDYSVLQEKFPKSKRMPAALFKIGNSFEAMGMKTDAKVFFQELVDRYPRSSEAKKVASKIR